MSKGSDGESTKSGTLRCDRTSPSPLHQCWAWNLTIGNGLQQASSCTRDRSWSCYHGLLREFKLHRCITQRKGLVWSCEGSTASSLEFMIFHELGSAVSVDFYIMILTSLAQMSYFCIWYTERFLYTRSPPPISLASSTLYNVQQQLGSVCIIKYRFKPCQWHLYNSWTSGQGQGSLRTLLDDSYLSDTILPHVQIESLIWFYPLPSMVLFTFTMAIW